MEKLPVSREPRLVESPKITAAEFDAKFDAGEDISEYIDWDTAVVVGPGELSPGHQSSMQAEAQQTASADGNLTATLYPFSVSLPAWAFDLLQQDAARKGISYEHWAQLILLQRIDKLRTSS